MSGSRKNLNLIVTQPNYSLRLRRKAWEIVLIHLKSNGIGHGAFLRLVQESIIAAQRDGVKISDFKGNPLIAETLTKDDLFGFLGGTKNLKDGPQRRISDNKFAVLDAYLLLIRDDMWQKFQEENRNIEDTLAEFWKGAYTPLGPFQRISSSSVWVTSESSISHIVEQASGRKELGSNFISALRIYPLENKSIFRVVQARIPICSSFFNSSFEYFGKVHAFSGDVEENTVGISIVTGVACLLHVKLGECKVFAILRDDLTREPRSVDWSIRSPFTPKHGPTFLWFSVREGSKSLRLIDLQQENWTSVQSSSSIFSERLFNSLQQIFSDDTSDGEK